MFVRGCVCLFCLKREDWGKGGRKGEELLWAGGFAGLLVGFFLVVGLLFIFWGLLIAYRRWDPGAGLLVYDGRRNMENVV
jgi:hypothetical protein